MSRLPIVGGDIGQWGMILNDYLSVEHNTDGTLKKADDIAYAKRKADAASVRFISVKLTDENTAITTGNGLVSMFIPPELNGMNLVSVFAGASTASSSGAPMIQVRNVTNSVDMLLTPLSIDVNEKTSATAITPAVIDTSNDNITTGNEIAIDIDNSGTGCKGLQVILGFRGI